MFTKFAVVQNLDSSGRVRVLSAQKDNMNWTFEYRRRPGLSDNKSIFPFVVTDSVAFVERAPGAETQCYRAADGIVHFSDDYGVPEGFVICVLGPVGYVPTLIKFREKTSIPIYQSGFSDGSPGFVQLRSNRLTQQTGVLMMTTRNCLFGATIEFSPCSVDFPSEYRIADADTFQASVGLHSGNPAYLTQSDIQTYCENVPLDRQEELLSVLNELVGEMKSNQTGGRVSVATKETVSATVTGLIGLGSSVVTIGDSVSNHGFAYGFLRMIFGFFGTGT